MNVQYFDPKDPVNKLLAIGFFLAAFLKLGVFNFPKSSVVDAFILFLLSAAVAKNNFYPLAKHPWLWILIIATILLSVVILMS